jgi:hypothetical protein
MGNGGSSEMAVSFAVRGISGRLAGVMIGDSMLSILYSIKSTSIGPLHNQ